MFKVNKDKCIGCGACVGVCPEVFDFGDDGLAEVVKKPTEENMQKATEAFENCPTGAIEESKEENK